MYQKSRIKRSGDDFGHDSLMDILTCTVGFILLIILFAVLETRGAQLGLILPMAYEPPENARSLVLVCQNGTIRPINTSDALKKLKISTIKSYDEIEEFVANSSDFKDSFFRYTLSHQVDTTWYQGYGYTETKLFLEIHERKGKDGYSLREISNSSSNFNSLVSDLNPDSTWIYFTIDSKSLSIFRSARACFSNRSFATGWDSGEFEFPVKIDLFKEQSQSKLRPDIEPQ